MQVTYSVIIPAYNEAERIGPTLERALAYFADHPELGVEVLIVDDGSADGTAALIETWQAKSKYIRLLSHEKNMGKGWAVRTGMLAATGEYVLFMDADGSTDISNIEKLRDGLRGGADMAIGSRDVAGSEIRKHQPFVRETMGKAFSFLARVLAIPEVADTTCGFKLFKKSVVEPLFGRQTVGGWAFDVEILYLATKMGYEVAEVPVDWTDSPNSRVSLARVVLPTLLDLLRIRFIHRSVGQSKTAHQTD